MHDDCLDWCVLDLDHHFLESFPEQTHHILGWISPDFLDLGHDFLTLCHKFFAPLRHHPRKGNIHVKNDFV